MKAFEKFRFNQKVRATKEGVRIGACQIGERGRVVGFSYYDWGVRVLRNGRKQAVTYHMDLWEPEEKREYPKTHAKRN